MEGAMNIHDYIEALRSVRLTATDIAMLTLAEAAVMFMITYYIIKRMR